MKNLEGKVAIVTGGSRGIGAAIAKRLGTDGADVVVNYNRDEAAALEVAAQIEGLGCRTVAIQADMGDSAQIESLFSQAMQVFGRLDILVNNAGVSGFQALETIDVASYAHMFDINVRGPLLAMRQAAQYFGTQGGRVINISSSITRSPTSHWTIYAAGKAALEMMTACLAQELGPRHITVNAVAPGVTTTDMLHTVMPAEVQQAMTNNTALGRLGQPDDIADVVAFLCSHDGRWITGQTLIANGGLR